MSNLKLLGLCAAAALTLGASPALARHHHHHHHHGKKGHAKHNRVCPPDQPNCHYGDHVPTHG